MVPHLALGVVTPYVGAAVRDSSPLYRHFSGIDADSIVSRAANRAARLPEHPEGFASRPGRCNGRTAKKDGGGSEHGNVQIGVAGFHAGPRKTLVGRDATRKLRESEGDCCPRLARAVTRRGRLRRNGVWRVSTPGRPAWMPRPRQPGHEEEPGRAPVLGLWPAGRLLDRALEAAGNPFRGTTSTDQLSEALQVEPRGKRRTPRQAEPMESVPACPGSGRMQSKKRGVKKRYAKVKVGESRRQTAAHACCVLRFRVTQQRRPLP